MHSASDWNSLTVWYARLFGRDSQTHAVTAAADSFYYLMWNDSRTLQVV